MLLSVCSRGVVGKWSMDLEENGTDGGSMGQSARIQKLSDSLGMEGPLSVRAANFDKEAEMIVLAVEQGGERKFIGVDVNKLTLKWQTDQVSNINYPITAMAAKGNLLAYIVGKALIIERVAVMHSQQLKDI